MKPSRWRRLLSYLTEIPLEHRSSEHNAELTVALSRGRYQLYTENAVYSYADLYDNFRQAFRRIDLDHPPIERVLLLGLGLGSIPWMLERTFGRRYRYTAVEIDEEVIYLAGKYCLGELRSPMEVICADARQYVAVCAQRFDLICMDIFEDDTVPEAFEEAGFLRALQGLLTPGGRLLYNRLASRPGDRSSSLRFFRQVFLPVFPDAAKLEMKDNLVLLHDRRYLRRP